MTAKLLFFAGSARKDSTNKKLAKAASDLAKESGADVTFIDLADYDMPIYNQDIEDESGLPDNAKKIKQLMIDHDGFCIASPEYNASITPLLKNVIDWASRKEGDEAPLVAFKGKTACLLSASPGGLGGIRGLPEIRRILSGIGVHVIPQQLAVGGAYDKFDDKGHFTDDSQKKALQNIMEDFISITKAIKNS